MIKRVFLIVLDSFGIGEAPDAAEYGDSGSNTIAACVKAGMKLPNLEKMGLGNIEGIYGINKQGEPSAAYARMTEASKGKDTTIGHWEIAGIISPKAMPVFPNGFPKDFLESFEKEIGRKTLCNKPYSGVQVIADYGREHIETGAVIVYTSADSVFQIAAHEEKVPLEELYSICKTARNMLTGDLAVGRVIARPFTGEHPFVRTSNRHDYSVVPPKDTMLDALIGSGREVIAVGKISDIFAGKGVDESITTKGNADGMEKSAALLDRDFEGLCFINLVDFDMLYGHRNDAEGYAKALEQFDRWLGEAAKMLRDDDLLIITADHGCDPSSESTDHSREYTPMLAFGKAVRPVDLGTRKSFSDIAATILEAFGIKAEIDGESFWGNIAKQVEE